MGVSLLDKFNLQCLFHEVWIKYRRDFIGCVIFGLSAAWASLLHLRSISLGLSFAAFITITILTVLSSSLFLFIKSPSADSSTCSKDSLLFSLLHGISLFLLGSLVLPLDFISLLLPIVLCMVLLNRTNKKPIFKFLTFLIIFIFTILVAWWRAYELQFGIIALDQVAAIYQTTLIEASEYFISYLKPLSFGSAFLFSFVAVFFPVTPSGNGWKSRKAFLYSILIVSVVFSGFNCYSPAKIRAKAVQNSIVHFRADLSKSTGNSTIVSGIGSSVRENKIFNLIIVLSDAMTRRHMSLYGYHRETTPMLDSLRDSLFIQQDTVSVHSHTVPSLLSTFVHSYSGIGDQTVNLLDLLKNGGVETYWYSNQSIFGSWDNPVAQIGYHADHKEFISKSRDGIYRSLMDRSFDEALLPMLQKAQKDSIKAKFIVAHLFSVHGPFCESIPNIFRSTLKKEKDLGVKFFGDAEDFSESVNCYDNAIRYVDQLAGQIIKDASSSEHPTVIVFFPDHGEAPALGTGHNSGAHSAYHVEIPNIWYFNPVAQTLLSKKIGNLSRNLAKPFLLTNFYDSVADLFDIKVPGLVDSSKSLFSSSYKPAERILLKNSPNRLNYDKLSDDGKDYREITRLVLKQMHQQDVKAFSRIIAHRVNTLGNLWEAKEVFSGVELDVVFHSEQREFYVYHPPAINIGLSLAEYLKAAQSKPKLRFWFDWKNADENLIEAGIARLEELDKIYTLKKRTLIETGSDKITPKLRKLSADGWQHSYYLPTRSIIDCSRNDSARCQGLSKEIVRNADKISATALSFDFNGFRFIRNYRTILSKYRWNTWNTALSATSLDIADEINTIRSFDYYIVSFPSVFTR